MRLNVFLAQYTALSRRGADKAIEEGRVYLNGQPRRVGQTVQANDNVALDGRVITPDVKTLTIMLNKPPGYVCSRDGQGNKTIYELLPEELHHLNSVGRLDKDSSGLLLLTNDGQLANQLAHPRYQKTKVYEVRLNSVVSPEDLNRLKQGVMLEDGISKLDARQLEIKNQKLAKKALLVSGSFLQITMSEGRNRQIRRTFAALGYDIASLHRTRYGDYSLGNLTPGHYKKIDPS